MEENNTKFYLDLSDEGIWLIKEGEHRYTAGRNKEKALDLIKRLNESPKANVLQKSTNIIYVCWDHHEKYEDCQYVKEIDGVMDMTSFKQDLFEKVNELEDKLTITKTSRNFNSDKVKKLEQLIELKNKYIKLLGAENSELASSAANRGWISKRVEEGFRLREQMKSIEAKL